MHHGELPPFSRGVKERIATVTPSGISRADKAAILPKVTVNDEIYFLACRLADTGYYGGDPAAVMAAPVDMVEALIEYEAFKADYEHEYTVLNAPKTGA